MAGIFSGEAFTDKHVSQVAAAGNAAYFRPLSVGVRHARDRSRNFFIKAGPAASGVKFAL